jgi:hypothetical protein
MTTMFLEGTVTIRLSETKSKERARFSRQVAEEMLHRFGAFAHMHALEALESRDQEHSRKLWRDVLSTLDEIINERKQDDKPELRTTESDKPE